jgi:hypothetical protein
MNIKKIIIASLVISSLLAACEKTTKLLDENVKWTNVDTANMAQVKIIHAFPSLTPALPGGSGPVMTVFANDKKLAGTTASSFSLAYNGTFPASTAYSVLTPGSVTFSFVMNRYNTAGNFAPQAGDTLFQSTQNLVAGKKYSLFLVDTTEHPGVLAVEDNWTIPAPTNYQLRYANLVANPDDRYDVYSIRQVGNIFTNVGYRQVTNFINLPVPQISDTLIVRMAGTMTVIDSVKGFLPSPQRVYTAYSRGKTGVKGRTPATTYYTNR